MRLGGHPMDITPNTLLAEIYGGKAQVSERHRHRYEVNPVYRQALEDSGVVFSGQSPDGRLMEAMELRDHRWFVGCQYHPEYQSRPLRPHPLFAGFIGAAIAYAAQK